MEVISILTAEKNTTFLHFCTNVDKFIGQGRARREVSPSLLHPQPSCAQRMSGKLDASSSKSRKKNISTDSLFVNFKPFAAGGKWILKNEIRQRDELAGQGDHSL